MTVASFFRPAVPEVRDDEDELLSGEGFFVSPAIVNQSRNRGVLPVLYDSITARPLLLLSEATDYEQQNSSRGKQAASSSLLPLCHHSSLLLVLLWHHHLVLGPSPALG